MHVSCILDAEQWVWISTDYDGNRGDDNVESHNDG